MSRPINTSDTLTFVPNGNTGTTNLTASSQYPTSNGNTDHTSNTYVQFTTQTTAGYTYYTFPVSGIPEGASISSVSCIAKIRINNTSRVSNTNIRLYSGTTAKGSSKTFSSTSTSYTVTLNDATWTVSEVNNARLRFGGKKANSNYSGYIYFYGATLSVTYVLQGTEYEITSTLATDAVDSIDPAGQIYVMEGNDYELSIYAASIDDVIVEDNGVDVTNQLVRHQTQQGENTISKTADSFTTGFSGGSSMNFYTSSSSTGNNFNYAVGHTAESPGSTSSGSGSWTYVKEDGDSTNNTGYADFVFDFSEIPTNAIIKSVQVKCYGAIESTSQSTSHADITLFSGSTQKGTMQKFTSSTNSVITISNPGTWTRAELQSAKLRFAVGYYGGHIFGITWNVTYEIPIDTPYFWTYTITNIQADHDIEVGDNSSITKYLVSTSIRTNGCSVNNASVKQKEGADFTLIIYYSDINNLIVTDNGVNVNSLITGSSGTYYYALTSLSSNHNIIINEKPWYEVTIESLYSSATVSASSYKVYEGGSFTATVNVSNISSVVIKDNGIDVTSQFVRISSGVYRASYTNVNEDHEFIVVEANSYSINSISNTINAAISPSGTNSAVEGSSITFTITTDLSSDLLILKDNDIDVTSNLIYVSNGNYQYTLSSISSDHTIALYEVFVPEEEDPQKTYYSVNVSSINATTNPANGTIRVEKGDDQTIVIIPSESNITLATDNGVDITDQLIGGESTYDITTQVSGASYGFNLNSSTGYYVSTNNGVSKSASVARINFHMKTRCFVTIEYINYAEASYDYGMFGKIDTSVATDGLTASSNSSSPSDSTSNYQLAMASNSSSAQTITYTIEKGEHFVDIKYGKDDASDFGNDSLQWKILSVESLESTDLSYTINNIDEDHSLIFVFGEVVYYTVNTSGEGCRTYPTGDVVVLPNNGYSATIIPDYADYDFEIYDNGRNVTKNAEYFQTDKANYYVYAIKKVATDHTVVITFTEKTSSLYIKINNNWIQATKVYVKVNNAWVETENYQTIFNPTTIYVQK